MLQGSKAVATAGLPLRHAAGLPLCHAAGLPLSHAAGCRAVSAARLSLLHDCHYGTLQAACSCHLKLLRGRNPLFWAFDGAN